MHLEIVINIFLQRGLGLFAKDFALLEQVPLSFLSCKLPKHTILITFVFWIIILGLSEELQYF